MAAAVRVSIRARVICSQRAAERVMFGPGGSAAGPKPGRDGFSVELGGGQLRWLAAPRAPHSEDFDPHRRTIHAVIDKVLGIDQ